MQSLHSMEGEETGPFVSGDTSLTWCAKCVGQCFSLECSTEYVIVPMKCRVRRIGFNVKEEKLALLLYVSSPGQRSN